MISNVALSETIGNVVKQKGNASIERAKNWVMIALSRASNHLIIHIENRESFIGSMLREIYKDKIHERGKSEFLIEWRTI